MTIAPAFQRIARRLSAFELMADDAGGEGGGADLEPGPGGDRRSGRFLGFYSRDGLRRALEAYGVQAALAAQGLGDYDLVVDTRDPFLHRAEVLLGGVRDDDHRLVDLVVRQQRVRAVREGERVDPAESFSVLLVEWLCQQNPRAAFSRARPRLPGQRWPGLGLGFAMNNLTQLMAQRLGHDGVLVVPERFHLAVMYRRLGYQFAVARHRVEVELVEGGTRELHLATVAWAVERGFVRLPGEDGGAVEPWAYQPGEMAVAVSRRLQCHLGSRSSLLPWLLQLRRRRRVVVDLEGLRRSLEADPVEGLEPDRLTV